MFDILPCSSVDILANRADLFALLQDAVDSGASVSFMAPLDLTLAATFWDKVADEVANNQRIVVIARETDTGKLLGSAQLAFAMTPNGSQRAEIQKVLVLRSARRKGIARAMLFVLEILAWRAGKSLLVLDTADAGAEKLYERCGFVRAGVIPNYAFAPYGGLVDTVIYYKQLAPPGPDTPISAGVSAD